MPDLEYYWLCDHKHIFCPGLLKCPLTIIIHKCNLHVPCFARRGKAVRSNNTQRLASHCRVFRRLSRLTFLKLLAAISSSYAYMWYPCGFPTHSVVGLESCSTSLLITMHAMPPSLMLVKVTDMPQIIVSPIVLFHPTSLEKYGLARKTMVQCMS